MENAGNSTNEAPIQPGCEVRLVTEDRPMTVESIEGETAICIWQEGEETIRRSYLLGLLRQQE